MVIRVACLRLKSYTENCMQTLESFFLVKTFLEFGNLQISKILNTDTNRIFPIPFKFMYISLRYTQFEKQFRSG